MKVKNIKDILNAGYNSIQDNLNSQIIEFLEDIHTLTNNLVNENTALQLQMWAQICDSALLLQSQQQLNQQIDEQNENMDYILQQILDVIQSLRTAANVPQNAGLNQTLNTDITNLNKCLNAVNSQLSLSQINAQSEAQNLIINQNKCSNSTTPSPPTPSQSTPQSTTQSTPSPLTFCQSAKYCTQLNTTRSTFTYLADPNDCNSYYFCYLYTHYWCHGHCPPGQRFDSNSIDCVSDPSCLPKTTFGHNCTKPYETFAVPGDCTSYEWCYDDGRFAQACCTDDYLYNQNKDPAYRNDCDIPANASPKCTTNSL